MTADPINPYAAPRSSGQPENGEPLFAGRLTVTAFGLKLMCVGILLLVVQVLLSLFVGIPAQQGVVPIIYAVVVLGTIGLVAAGPFFCLAVPTETRLRPIVIISAAMLILAMGSGFYSLLPRAEGKWIVVCVGFLFVAAAVFLLFLYRLAVVIQRFDLAMRSRGIFILWTCMATTFFAAALMSSIWRPSVWMLILLLASLASGVLFMLSYASLVNSISNAIRHHG